MTNERYEQLKENLENAATKKGHITATKQYHERLLTWDKDGSHKDKIIEAIESIKNHRAELSVFLDGYTYDELKLIVQKARKLINDISASERRTIKLKEQFQCL